MHKPMERIKAISNCLKCRINKRRALFSSIGVCITTKIVLASYVIAVSRSRLGGAHPESTHKFEIRELMNQIGRPASKYLVTLTLKLKYAVVTTRGQNIFLNKANVSKNFN